MEFSEILSLVDKVDYGLTHVMIPVSGIYKCVHTAFTAHVVASTIPVITEQFTAWELLSLHMKVGFHNRCCAVIALPGVDISSFVSLHVREVLQANYCALYFKKMQLFKLWNKDYQRGIIWTCDFFNSYSLELLKRGWKWKIQQKK